MNFKRHTVVLQSSIMKRDASRQLAEQHLDWDLTGCPSPHIEG
jgi:hypothetical protein